jgi:hypothetical protein
MRVGLAARNKDKLAPLASELKAEAFACDASKPADVEAMFKAADAALGGPPEVVVYNPSARVRGPLVELDPDGVANALAVSAFGGFLVAQAAVKRMLPKGQGAVLFTGASASVKGYPGSAAFAMGKFALRGLAQSMARELAPKGIHVAHFVIDGGIRSSRRPGRGGRARQPVGPGRDRAELPPRVGAGPERLDLGDRTAALGGEVLTEPAPPYFLTTLLSYPSGRRAFGQKARPRRRWPGGVALLPYCLSALLSRSGRFRAKGAVRALAAGLYPVPARGRERSSPR